VRTGPSWFGAASVESGSLPTLGRVLGAKTIQVAGGIFMLMLTPTVNGLHSWAAYPWGCFWAVATIMTIVAYREPY
jgi:hypothetical protein